MTNHEDDFEQLKFLNDPVRVRAQIEREKTAATVVIGVALLIVAFMFPALLSIPFWILGALMAFVGFIGASQDTLSGRDTASSLFISGILFAVAYHVAW